MCVEGGKGGGFQGRLHVLSACLRFASPANFAFRLYHCFLRLLIIVSSFGSPSICLTTPETAGTRCSILPRSHCCRASQPTVTSSHSCLIPTTVLSKVTTVQLDLSRLRSTWAQHRFLPQFPLETRVRVWYLKQPFQWHPFPAMSLRRRRLSQLHFHRHCDRRCVFNQLPQVGQFLLSFILLQYLLCLRRFRSHSHQQVPRHLLFLLSCRLVFNSCSSLGQGFRLSHSSWCPKLLLGSTLIWQNFCRPLSAIKIANHSFCSTALLS